MSTNELMTAFEKLNSENKRKVINYAKHLEFTVPGNNDIGYGYLNGVSETTKKFFIEVLENENLNLWGSMYNILENKTYESLDDAVSYYYNKYRDLRPYIINRQNELLEIFQVINRSRKVKGKSYIEN